MEPNRAPDGEPGCRSVLVVAQGRAVSLPQGRGKDCRVWMQLIVPLCVPAPAMARPQNTESADFRCSNGGVVASLKSDPRCDNEYRRLTQNCYWDLPTTEAMCRYLNRWHDSEDRVALAEQNPPHRLTIDNTDPPETMT